MIQEKYMPKSFVKKFLVLIYSNLSSFICLFLQVSCLRNHCFTEGHKDL